MLFITGANGCIGTQLSYEFSIKDNYIGLVDLEFKRLDKVGVQYIADLGELSSVYNLVLNHREREASSFIHAAAYKYVDKAELDIHRTFKSNVCSVLNIIEAYKNLNSFLQISTDKAVYPVGVMGATKRLAELLVLQWAKENPSKRGIIVRFGNVYGSSGSVVPLMQEQIKNGGPVLLTHLEATRYFITMQEAIELITAAEKKGLSGEIWSRDMGTPIRIKELAEKLIVQAGKEPYKEVQIKEIGLRPGEKLHEQLWYNNENQIKDKESQYVIGIPNKEVYQHDWIDEVRWLQKNISKIEAPILRKEIFNIVGKSFLH